MKRIVIAEFMDIASVDRLRDHFDVQYDPHLVDDRQNLIESLGDCDGLIVRNRTQVNANLLDNAPHLKIVGRLGVGLDNIDVASCKAREIVVAPATGANTVSVAEYVIGAALTLVRGAFGATQSVAEGDWPRQRLMGGELFGKTMGLVGYGAIARAVAGRARAFGMTIAAHDPHLPASDPLWEGTDNLGFEALLTRADILSLHVPLTEQTRHMIDAKALAAMKDTAVVVNTARGGVVDDAALARALAEKNIGGAALDVFEIEPMTAASGAAFAELDNVVLTPHIAGVTGESNVRVSAVIADAMIAALGE